MVKRKISFWQKIGKWFSGLGDKAKFALVGFRYLLSSPAYVACFFLVALLFLYILAQLQEGGVSWGLLWSGLPFERKLGVFGTSLALIGNCFTSLHGLVLILLSLMQGLAVSGIVYAVKNRQKDEALNHASASSIASVLAFITLGCPTCGITILTPILTMFAGAGAVALAERLGVALTVVAFILLAYSLIQLGYLIFVNVSANRAKEKHAESD